MANIAAAKVYGFITSPSGQTEPTRIAAGEDRYIPTQVALVPYTDSQIVAGTKIIFLNANINGGLDYAWLSNEAPAAIAAKLNAPLA